MTEKNGCVMQKDSERNHRTISEEYCFCGKSELNRFSVVVAVVGASLRLMLVSVYLVTINWSHKHTSPIDKWNQSPRSFL